MDYIFYIKKIFICIFIILAFLIICRLAIFYVPFLIAYLISLIIEPIIKFINKRTNLSRKTSSIIALITLFSVFVSLISYGIIKLILETTNLLDNLNTYLDTMKIFLNGITSKIDLEYSGLSNEVVEILKGSATDFLNTIAGYVKTFLSGALNYITSIPTIFINIVIMSLATYFITSDKFYILDRMEHHLSKKMMGRIMIHAKDITTTLGKYLKAEITMSFITFIIVLTGLNIFYLLGMEVEYPILMALLIGFIDALPILGAGSIMIPWSLVLFISNQNSLALSILGLYIFIVVTKQFLEPKIVSNHIGIHPIFTLLAMYTSFKIIGVIGLLIGPIILIILKNIFSEVLDKGIVNTLIDD